MKGKIYEKGITLIALVITIIVLLILAGVTLNLVFNQGLIEKSQTAVDEYKVAEYKENIETIKTGEYFKKISEKLPESLKDLLVDKLENETWVKTLEISEENPELEENQIKIITQDKYIIVVEINDDGKITYTTIERDNGEPYPSLDAEVLPLEGIENEKVKIQVKAEVEKSKNTKKIAKIELILDNTVIETKTYGGLAVEDIFEVEENGTYRIKVITDQGKSTSKKVVVNIQGTENEIQMTAEPKTARNTESTGTQNGVETGSITVTINYGETELQKQYSFDGENWINVEGESIQIPVTENTKIVARYFDGKNSFKVENYSVKNVDNVAPNAFDITATNTTNSITVTANAEDTASAGAASGTEGILRYEYRIDNGSWQNNDGKFTNLPTGTYTVQAKAIDKAGNERISTNTLNVELGEISVEDITINAEPKTSRNTESDGTQNGIETGPITVTITYGKSNYTKQYKVGSGDWQTVTEATKTIEVTENTKIVARYYDETNGFETENYNIQNVDNVAPTFTSYDATVSGTTITASATANDTASAGAASGTEGILRYEYRIDNGSWQTGNTFTISTGGNYTIYIKAIDKAGNETIVNTTVTATSYTISYNANGGSGSMSAGTKMHGSSYTIPSCGFTAPSGYTFAGWTTSSTATEITYNVGATYTADESATLYAVWKINTLEFSGTGNKLYTVDTGSLVANYYCATLNITIPEGGYTVSGTVNSGPSSGHIYFTDVSGNVTTIAKYAGSTITNSFSITEKGTLTLYGTSSIDMTVTSTGEKVPLEFNGYTILYDMNGGQYRGPSYEATKMVEKGKNITILSNSYPYKDGYTLLGWSEDASATTATYAPGATITPTKDMTLYAVWGELENFRIGTKTYGTLKSAFNAVKDGETITLLNNIDVNPGSPNTSDFGASLEDGKSVTFNMNGYNIKSPYATFTTNGTSSLNIIGNGKISSYGGASINNNSTGIVTINEGVTLSYGGPTTIIVNNNTGTIVVNGATVSQSNSSSTAILINKGYIYIKNNAKISSAGTGIVNKEGTLYVEENASISCGGSYGIENNATGTVILGNDDGIINSTTPEVYAPAKAAIKNEGILKFYDGICNSMYSAISNSGTIIAPTGGSVVYGSYNSNTKLYQKATVSKN